MKKSLIFLVFMVVIISGCEKVLGIDEYTEGEIDTVNYNIIRDDGNYWEDEYCPLADDGSPVLVSNECRGITSKGCCDTSGRVLYCELNRLYCIPCKAAEYSCSWSPESHSYYCTLDDNGQDPGGSTRACQAFLD
jgi:uncharacterized protein YceK